MTKAIRVLIVDDHAIMREGLKQLFALVDDLAVSGEAENGAEALARLGADDIDLILLDMTMPGISGENLIAQVHLRYPALPILVLSMHDEPQIARRALEAGASGYVTKDRNPETLLAAMRCVAGGGRFVDPRLAEAAAPGTPLLAGRASHEDLGERELQVMHLLARGISVNRIAEDLAISSKTVSTHKARMMRKMGFASNADIVRYAIVHGLIE